MTAHPLFLSEDPDKPSPDGIEAITLRRLAGAKSETYPRLFPASDLTSLEQISESFGGGDYLLLGRNAHQIVARRQVTLPGPPKPFSEETHAPITPSGGSGGRGSDAGGVNLSAVLIAMMQSQQQAQTSLMTMIGTLASAFLSKPAAPSENSQIVNLLMKTSSDDKAMLTTLLSKLADARNGPSDTSTTLERGLQMGMELASVMHGGTDDDGNGWTPETILETVKAVTAGVQTMKQQPAPARTVVDTTAAPAPGGEG